MINEQASAGTANELAARLSSKVRYYLWLHDDLL
ncbi:hypothetical protein SLEP1_g19826 [Rubroshorea leprosula]|uniref:Uncharacterized protein n=1 Tax=Rubroshorea leprosula TaxID=152421 RepID=A0AAV5J9W0_9ROSI|nr:hypothetical protein SLEP1_g19826 [Rubroshorea leprosula]